MTERQKQIEEMAHVLGEDSFLCKGEKFDCNKCIFRSKPTEKKTDCVNLTRATRLHNAGFGNIKDLAEKIKVKIKQVYCVEDTWEIIDCINDAVKEYLGE